MNRRLPFAHCAGLLGAIVIATGTALAQQPITCQAGAAPVQVRAEGKAEQVGSILLDCRGTPNTTGLRTNLVVILDRTITNGAIGTDILPGVTLTIDQGAGPVAASVPAMKSGSSSLAFNGVDFSIPSSGHVVFTISQVRADVSNSAQPVRAFVSTNGATNLLLSSNNFAVAQPVTGLFTTGTAVPISCGRSVLPSFSFQDALDQRTVFFTARATEGFATAFAPRESGADYGTRLIIRYTGFPTDATLAVPDVIAGSSSNQPTSTGDFGKSNSAGTYTPGSLLLVRVLGTDANGAGGVLVTGGSTSALPFGVLREASSANNSRFAVYEVADANPAIRESALLPTFIDWRPVSNITAIGSVDVTLGPVGDVGVPRFANVAPTTDCGVVGDCGSGRFPELDVDTKPVTLTVTQGAGMQPIWIPVRNEAGGIMQWVARVVYNNNITGWIRLEETGGINNATVRADLLPDKLPGPGTYQASIVIDAGPVTGTKTVPVTFIVLPNPALTNPAITSVSMAAVTTETAIVPGSLVTLKGTLLGGKDVAVKMDSMAATVVSAKMDQITFQAPLALAGKNSASLVVTADGKDSPPVTVQLKPVFPAVLAAGVLNSTGTVNSPADPAVIGTTVRVLFTGIPAASLDSLNVRMHDWEGLVPIQTGAVADQLGVSYLDVMVPVGIPGITSDLALCAQATTGSVCGTPVKISMIEGAPVSE